jgi:hypothetical protein
VILKGWLKERMTKDFFRSKIFNAATKLNKPTWPIFQVTVVKNINLIGFLHNPFLSLIAVLTIYGAP